MRISRRSEDELRRRHRKGAAGGAGFKRHSVGYKPMAHAINDV